MTIDMHAHWQPAALADALRARPQLPRITAGDDGAEIMEDQRGRRPPKFDEAAKEFERTIRMPGMIGAMLPGTRR